MTGGPVAARGALPAVPIATPSAIWYRPAVHLATIVVPVFNERRHLLDVLRRIAAVPLDKEILLVDDCSTDGTRDLLRRLDIEGPEQLGLPTLAEGSSHRTAYRVLFHEQNRGKGAALRTGFREVSGDVVCIQDADLEYDPAELPRLIETVRSGEADCAFGSRFLGTGTRGYLANWLANRFLTWLSNRTTGLRLTDMETCYKVMRADLLRSIRVEEDRFGFEPEVTAKLALTGARILELPISYAARRHSEGKKIGVRDGLRAIYCILKYGLRPAPRGLRGGSAGIGAQIPRRDVE
jgi:glycosyltransferase involved in cell wall biosynthesis